MVLEINTSSSVRQSSPAASVNPNCQQSKKIITSRAYVMTADQAELDSTVVTAYQNKSETSMQSQDTAAADAQRSSPPVGTYSTGSSPEPFKPSEPRGLACSIF
ncbi:ABC transporter B family member 20 [Dorcoceras hygrometricum]|uniref:ABC transporter B family member 20 n=1 Tax=Dorcoceras hygrometricum TaxID=472368 RepID=A0A2Z7AH45_9LAMI|nr:ABC transporter B family member 20 [Dorcoceras hygrometricum]